MAIDSHIDTQIDTATWADSPAIRTVLARAYHDNPLMVWALPDAATRDDACAAWLGPSVERYLAAGRVHVARCDGAVVGVAAWRPARVAAPDTSLPTPAGMLALLVGAVRAHEIRTALAGAAPFAPDRPSAYLNFLAVAPAQQGRGIGRRLLDTGIEAAQSERVGTYLATSDPRNLPFYARAGFSVAGGVQLGDGPYLTVLHGSG